MRSQVLGHRLIKAGLITQFRLPVRIGQAAHIKHQIGIHRHPTLEAKRLDQKCGARLWLVQQAQLDGIPQLIQVQAGGVDLEVGQIDDRSQQRGLVLDGFGQRAVRAAEGVAATGFGKTLEQCLLIGVQVQHIAIDMLGAYFLKQLRKALKMAGQVAGVNRDGNQGLRQLGVDQCTFRQLRQQTGGQVVDAIKTVVLKDVEGGAFTRAGAAADDDQTHDYCPFCSSRTT